MPGVAIHVVATELDPSQDLLPDVQNNMRLERKLAKRLFFPGPSSRIPPVAFHYLTKVGRRSTQKRLQGLQQTPQSRHRRDCFARGEQRGPKLKRTCYRWLSIWPNQLSMMRKQRYVLHKCLYSTARLWVASKSRAGPFGMMLFGERLW